MQNKLLLVAGVVLSLGLSACGGGSLDSPPPVATTPTPSPEPTATPAVTPPPPAVIDVALNVDTWETDPGTLVKQDVSGGVRFEPTAAGQQFRAIIPGDSPLQGAGINMVLEADAAFVASDAEFQVIIQQNGGGFGGFFGCYVSNADLDASATITISAANCVATGDALDSPPPDDAGFRFGIQIESGGTVAGGLSVLQAQIVPVGASVPTPTPNPNALDLTASANWETDGTDAPAYTAEGVSFMPTANNQQLRIIEPAPTGDYNGATLQITVSATDDFIASGMGLQAMIQFNQGTFGGFFGCEIGSDDFDMGVAMVECTTPADAGLNLTTDGESLRIGIKTNSDVTSTGTVTITEYVIIPAGDPGPNPNALDLSASANWESDGAPAPAYTAEGVSFMPTGNNQQLRIIEPAPTGNYNGATLEITLSATDDFIASGMGLQAMIQFNQGTFGGFFGCEINPGDFDMGVATVECTTPADAGLNLTTDGESLRIGIKTNSDVTSTGTVTITEYIITPATP